MEARSQGWRIRPRPSARLRARSQRRPHRPKHWRPRYISARRAAIRRAAAQLCRQIGGEDADAARRVAYVRLNRELIEGKQSPFWQRPGEGLFTVPLPEGGRAHVVVDRSEMLDCRSFHERRSSREGSGEPRDRLLSSQRTALRFDPRRPRSRRRRAREIRRCINSPCGHRGRGGAILTK